MSLQTSQISSATNPQFKIWNSLSTTKGIKEHQQFILMGAKLVSEFLLSPVPGFKIETLLNLEKNEQYPHIRQTLLSKELFKELDVLGTHSSLLVLSFEGIPEADLSQKPIGLEIISPLGDPRNLGALTRTALSFGARQIILTQESTHPYLPHSVKASAGAVLKMKFSKTKLSTSEISVIGENYALALQGENIMKVSWPSHLRLWVGEEGPGLKLNTHQSKQLKFIHIPTNHVESLNANVSASLAIWEWKKNQK